MARLLQPHRRLTGRLALVAGLLAVLAGCSKPAPSSGPTAATTAPTPPDKIRFKTDWYPQAEHGGFYEAQAEGLYRAANLDVEIIPGGPGVTVPQLMMAGECDLAMGRSDDLIVYAQQGLSFVIVAVYMEHDPQALMVHDEDTVKTFADLNHRSIMANPGVHWLDYLRQRYHIDVQQIPMNYGLAQFIADKTFIQQCFVTNEPYYARLNGAHPRTLLLSESGYNPYRIIFTTRSFLKTHEDAVRRFVAASLRGWEDYMNGDPTKANALILQRNAKMTPDFINFSIKAMHDQHIVSGKPEEGERLGLMTKKRMLEQVDVLVRLKIMPAPLPLDSFVRFDLLPADLQAAAN